jgi:hypothetical protein
VTKLERLFPVFGIAFALIYAPSMNNNWALATYHPRLGIWEWGVAPPINGPAMYWYGFVFTAGLGALVVTAIAALIPERIMARVPWPILTCVAPLCAMFYFVWVLYPYFTK